MIISNGFQKNLNKISLRLLHALRIAPILYARNKKRIKDYDLIFKIKNEVDCELAVSEAYNILMCVDKSSKLKGDLAEVGVYKGASAKLICEKKEKRKLYLFDTFSGLHDVQQIDKKYFYNSKYTSNQKMVEDYLSDYKNVFTYKGYFPATSNPIKNKKFSFVHLDVDTYKSTKNCLKFFYTRMVRGGIILSHDYANTLGVKKAFDNFFKNKPELILELSDTQCLVSKY